VAAAIDLAAVSRQIVIASVVIGPVVGPAMTGQVIVARVVIGPVVPAPVPYLGRGLAPVAVVMSPVVDPAADARQGDPPLQGLEHEVTPSAPLARLHDRSSSW
jgi:hypothetical protein